MPLCSASSGNIPIDVLRKVHYIKKRGSSAAFPPTFKNYPAFFDFILMKIPPAADNADSDTLLCYNRRVETWR